MSIHKFPLTSVNLTLPIRYIILNLTVAKPILFYTLYINAGKVVLFPLFQKVMLQSKYIK